MSWLPGLEPLATAWLAALSERALEASLLALLVLAVVSCGRRLTGPLRYGLLLVALLKFLLPPIAAPWAPPRLLPRAAVSRAAAAAHPDHGSVTEHGDREPEASIGASESAPPGARQASAPSQPSAQRDAAAPATPAVPWPVCLLLLQGAGALVILARRLDRQRRLARLARRFVAVQRHDLQVALRLAARRQGLRRPPALVASPDRLGPAATGLLRRRVVLPLEVAAAMPARRLAPILEHEVAHHRRLDLWVDLLVTLGALVWWPNPVYWLVARGLRRSREDCCDAVALATVPRHTYCRCLLDVAAALGGRRPGLPALAHGGLSHPLGRRIRHIMSTADAARSTLTPTAVAAILAVAILVLPCAATGALPTGAMPPPEAAPSTEVAPGAQASLPSAATAAPSSAPAATRQSLSVDDRVVKLSRDLVDLLVDKGLDRGLVESFDGSPDRHVPLAELREWVQLGVEPALPDEIAAWGLDGVYVSELVRLVWSDADAAYLRSLRQLQYADFDLDDAIRMARYEVTADWIGSWKDGGYDDLDVDDLVRLRRYEVEPAYAATYLEAGYDLSVDDLVRLHRYEVDQDAVARLAAAGLADFSVDDLIRLQRYEVTPEYAAAMRAAGGDFDTDELVRLRRYEIDAETVRALTDTGYGDLGVDDIVRLHRYEVTPAYIRGLREASTRSFGVDEIVTMKRYEVTPEYLRGLSGVGFGDLSVDDLARLRRYEVTPGFIERLQQAGFEDLTVDRIIRMKRAGS